MRDNDKTKEQLIAELTQLRRLKGASCGRMKVDSDCSDNYLQIIDDLPQMVYEVDEQGLISYANRETARLFGYTPEEVRKGIQVRNLFHPDDVERAAENMRRIMNGEPITGEEYRMICKNGKVFPVKVFSQPVFQDDRAVAIRGTLVDISESKRAEEALRKSKNHYRTIFNNTGTAMVLFGQDSVISSCNDQFATLSGYPKEDIEGILRWFDFIAPESLEQSHRFHESRSKSLPGAPSDFETIFITKAGRRRIIHAFIQIIPGTDQRACSIIDITARKLTEQALRRSERRYELVVQGANDGIWDWDLETDSVYFSPRYKAILGYEDSEFDNTADAWNTSIHPEDRDEALKANIECIEGKVDQFEVEYRMRHKDGSWRWILGRGASATNAQGKVYRMAGTHTDITSRKTEERTTEALYAISKAVSLADDLPQLYRSIHSILGKVIEATNFFIYLYDRETDSAALTYWKNEPVSNETIEAVSFPDTLNPTAEIIRTGKPLFLTRQTPESTRELERIGTSSAAAWIGVPLKVRTNIIGTMAVQDYDNPFRYSESDMSIMEAASEQVALAIERKRGEEALTRLNEELESKVEERTAELRNQTAELEAANERLTELDEIKSALVSSISHEMRTPLTSIRGFSKLAIRDFKRFFLPLSTTPKLEARGTRIISNLEIIENEGTRLTRLINDFLDINRIESGKTAWNDVLFNPTQVIAQAVSALSGVFSEKPGVNLEADIPPTSAQIHADPDKIQQVVINLLGNAAKYTSKGNVTVSLREGLGTIIVSVSDTGVGIPEEEQEYIFEKFHRSCTGDTILKSDNGAGLGLAISREIITHYDGSLWVESTPGKGSTFSFSLNKT